VELTIQNQITVPGKIKFNLSLAIGFRKPPATGATDLDVNFTLQQVKMAQRGVQLELYAFFNLGVRWGG